MSDSQNGINSDGMHQDENHSLHRFERNRFFNGKLMTARDMLAEQEYHTDRLETVTSQVTGWGIVCGLDARVGVPEGAERPQVVVEAGVAIDRAGRLIVVPDDHTEPLKESIGTINEDVSVYLRHDTCLTESVPAHGSEDACKEECDYNRTVETYEVVVESGPPIGENEEEEPTGEQKPLRLEQVEFPARDEVDKDETTEAGRIANVNDAAHLPARHYHELQDEDFQYRAVRDCETPEPGKVFLGHFESNDDGVWSVVDYWDEDTEPRPYVYTNDMLYTGLVDHATDFENPHELSLSVQRIDGGAALGVDDGEVTVTGAEGTTVSVDGQTVTITGGSGEMDVLEPLVYYLEESKLRRDALREVACAFEELRDQFEYVHSDLDANTSAPTKIADDIATTTRNGLASNTPFDEVYDEPDSFGTFVDESLLEEFESFEESLPEFVGGQDELASADSTLRTIVDSAVGDSLTQNESNVVAIELLRYAKVASCLSGQCIAFDHLDDYTPVTSPLSIKDVVVDPKLVQVPALWEFVPTVVPTEDSKALEFLESGLRIELPPTDTASVTVRKGTGFTLTGIDDQGTTINSDNGDAPRDTTTTLSVSTSSGDRPITYLDLSFEMGEKQSLVPDNEDGVIGELSDEQREILEGLTTGQLLSMCIQ